LRSPPLFVITKQLDSTLDNLFYKILEQRGNIREAIIKYLRLSYPSDEWSLSLIQGLLSDDLHLFMQFSYQTMLAIEMIEKELAENIVLDSIIEQGALNDYMFTKYFKYINKNDTFEKVLNDALLKHGYKIVKIGSGNFITNPNRFKPTLPIENPQIFHYDYKKCAHCITD
jgi:hypothetical protein